MYLKEHSIKQAGINAQKCPSLPARAHRCTDSVTSDDMSLIWTRYTPIARYWARPDHAETWTFNHPQIWAGQPAYNPIWTNLGIGALIVAWTCWDGSRAMFLALNQCTHLYINAPANPPMLIFKHRCRAQCANGCLWALGKGSPLYCFISEYGL